MTKINISIPKPCHEDWQAMTPENKGRFCASCQKSVIDFTNSTDREIVRAFQKDNNLCGRFLATQLDRDLVKPEKKSTLWIAATSSLLSLIGLNDAIAQEKAPTEKTDNNFALGKIIPPKTQSSFNTTTEIIQLEEIEVSGIVSDISGPLPGAVITIRGTKISTQTDFDGKYTIKAKENDVLDFNFVGMNSKEIKASHDNAVNLNVELTYSIMGEVITDGYKRRTFIGRIFHSIGNLFR